MIATPCNARFGLTACIARLLEMGASACAQLQLLLCLSACGVEREAPRGMKEDIAQTGVFAISRTLFIQTESVQLILAFYLIMSAATGYREHSEFALLMESLTWVVMFVMLGIVAFLLVVVEAAKIPKINALWIRWLPPEARPVKPLFSLSVPLEPPRAVLVIA
jgi:hypothetical protein